jgi:Transglycosylase
MPMALQAEATPSDSSIMRATRTQFATSRHWYLNGEYFGHGFYGVTTTAHGYFDADPHDLTFHRRHETLLRRGPAPDPAVQGILSCCAAP